MCLNNIPHVPKQICPLRPKVRIKLADYINLFDLQKINALSTPYFVHVRTLAHTQQLYIRRKLDTLELLNLNLGPAPSPNSISLLSDFDKPSSTWISTIGRSCTIEVSRILSPQLDCAGFRVCSMRRRGGYGSGGPHRRVPHSAGTLFLTD